jgi:hypothetical protein
LAQAQLFWTNTLHSQRVFSGSDLRRALLSGSFVYRTSPFPGKVFTAVNKFKLAVSKNVDMEGEFLYHQFS